MTFDVKIKKWHAVASWTWNAGGTGRVLHALAAACVRRPHHPLTCSAAWLRRSLCLRRLPLIVRALDAARLRSPVLAKPPPPPPWLSALLASPTLQATTCAASAACPSTAARPTASTLETTRRWCGGSARMPSTCSASTGGGGGGLDGWGQHCCLVRVAIRAGNWCACE